MSTAQDKITQAVAFINDARKLNTTEQKKHAPITFEWQIHEAIDDKLFDALKLLGD